VQRTQTVEHPRWSDLAIQLFQSIEGHHLVFGAVDSVLTMAGGSDSIPSQQS
jgi:hypothetical protein